jgi:hypothetical protein
MKNISDLRLFWIFLALPCTMFAQVGNEVYGEYQRVLDALDGLSNTLYKIDMRMYDDFASSEPGETLEIEIWVGEDGEMLFSTEEVVYFVTEGEYVLINHPQQQVTVHDRANENFEFSSILAQDMRPLIVELGLFPLRYNPGNNLSGISFSAPGLSKNLIKIEYDPVTFLPALMASSIDLSKKPDYYHEFDQHRVEAVYRDYQLGIEIPPLKVEEVFIKRNNQLSGVGRFKEYSVSATSPQ